MLCKDLRAKAVTGSPVVDVRQKPFRFRQSRVIIPDLFDEERMEVVFFVITVRQVVQKTFRLRCTGQFFCPLAQKRCPHPDHRFRRDGGHQFALEHLILCVLQSK